MTLKIAGTSYSKKAAGAYFLQQSDVEYTHSGAEVLNMVLGGGWAQSRINNIIGDSGTGKTGIAIEAAINFKKRFPKGEVRYCEPEAAFGRAFAKELGMPVKDIDFTEDDADIGTVEDWFNDIDTWLDNLKKNQGMYVLDSLDSLSSEAELERQIRDKSYGDGKAAKMSQAFRRLVQKVKQKNAMVFIISQVRDNIGATFGHKQRRSGGRALDFYASQIIWLAHLGRIERTIQGVKRDIAIKTKVWCQKNKTGMPFRTCEIDFRFGYGLDDVASNIKFLASVGRLNLVEPGIHPDKVQVYINKLDEKSDLEYNRLRQKVATLVPDIWREVERAFLPNRKKYR